MGAGCCICVLEIQGYGGLHLGLESEWCCWTDISDVSQVPGEYPDLGTDVVLQWELETRTLGVRALSQFCSVTDTWGLCLCCGFLSLRLPARWFMCTWLLFTQSSFVMCIKSSCIFFSMKSWWWFFDNFAVVTLLEKHWHTALEHWCRFVSLLVLMVSMA